MKSNENICECGRGVVTNEIFMICESCDKEFKEFISLVKRLHSVYYSFDFFIDFTNRTATAILFEPEKSEKFQFSKELFDVLKSQIIPEIETLIRKSNGCKYSIVSVFLITNKI